MLVGVVSLVVLVAAAGGAGWFYINYRLDNIPRITLPAHLLSTAAGGHPFDVLFFGPQSETSSSGSAPSDLVAAGEMIVVARFVPATHEVTLLSIPPDLSVDVPGHTVGASGIGPISAAFRDGPALLVQTVEQVLHIPVSHVVEVGSGGLSGLIAAFGGVYLDFPMPLEDPKSGLDVTVTGCQLVGASEALELVGSSSPYYFEQHVWHKETQADIGKVRQQAAMLSSLFSRAKGPLGDPFGWNGLIGTAAGSLRIDSTWTPGELISLGRQMRDVQAGSLHSESLPATEGAGGTSVEPATKDTIGAFVALGATAGGASRSSSAGANGAAPEPWDPVPCHP